MTDISPVLRHYTGDCRPLQIEPLGAAGGMSGAQFWRITAPRGALVLRCWPTEHPTPQRLRFIHDVLAHAATRGVTIVPVPIQATTSESFIRQGGHLWELAPWMPGAADYERAPNEGKLRAAMTALAQFHLAVANFDGGATQRDAVALPPITRRMARLDELLHGGIQELSHAISDNTWPELVRLARQFVDQLPRVVRRALALLKPLANAPLPLQPCIRDIWHDHVLFTGDEVAGIIDFGALDIDTPATDIARLLGSLVGDDAAGWQSGIAANSAIRKLSPEESLAVVALDTSGTILAGCNWIRWIYIDKRRFENHTQVVERVRRIVQRANGL